jgi:ubiquinone/menaquinone biosynthesis C-methylase UbiE
MYLDSRGSKVMPVGMHSLLERQTTELFSSAKGYDLVAEHYDSWAWQDFWRRNEFPIVLEKLIEAAPTRGILDVGVGTGAFLSYAAAHFPPDLRLSGLDISAGMLNQARSRLGARVELLQANVQEQLPFSDNSFDVVIMMRVANHLTILGNVVSEIGRVLCPGGLFLSTDLADEYDYLCTKIPSAESKICIETFKHSIAEWRCALQEKFSAIEVDEFTPAQLGELSVGSTNAKLLSKNVPLFKLITARRRP